MKRIITVMLNPSVDIMLLLDGLKKGKTNRADLALKNLGGKGLNVALVARSFGIYTTATGFIGADKAEELFKILAAQDIQNAFITIDGLTRTNLKLLDTSDMVMTEVNGASTGVSKEDIDKLEKRIDEMLSDADILVLTGSIPEGVDKSFYARYVKKANEAGINTIVDSSGEALKLALEQKPYAVKPNIDELCELAGRPLNSDSEIVEYMKSISRGGVNTVVTSMGKRGAFFVQNEECLFAESIDIDIKSAVGSGDSMVGAMAYAIAESISLKRLARLAVAAGCITASKTGTVLCHGNEAIKAEKSVRITEVDSEN